MNDEKTKLSFEFGSFRLDADAGRLLRRDGEPVALTAKAFQTLLALLEKRGRVVEKEELLERVWPDTFVEENSVAKHVSMLRQALGEGSGGHKYIETIPRRGYRFVARVVEHDEGRATSAREEELVAGVTLEAESGEPPHTSADTEVAGEPQRTGEGTDEGDAELKTGGKAAAPRAGASRVAAHSAAKVAAAIGRRGSVMLLTAALLVAAPAAYLTRLKWPATAAARSEPEPPRRSLAILPFRNLKREEAETEFLGLWLSDAITTKLSYVSALTVRPSCYVRKYSKEEIDPRRVSGELKVNTLLTGNFLREGDKLRLTAQLIDVERDEILWRDMIEVQYDNLLAAPDQYTQRVVAELRTSLTPDESRRLARRAPQNPQAYEYYLRGRGMISTDQHRSAITMLKRAIALDAQFALAWAFLGKAYGVSALQHFGGEAMLTKAQEAFEQALALDPENLETRVLVANHYTETNRVAEAVALLREILKVNPNNPYARWELSYAYRYAGLLDESIAEGEQALRLDPLLASHLFNSYFYAGQYEKFLHSLPPQQNPYITFYHGLARLYLGDRELAAEAFDRAHALDSAPALSHVGRAFSLALRGQKHEGLTILKAAEEKATACVLRDGEIIYKIAQAYAALGDRESALRALRQSVESGFFCHAYFVNDPLLADVRDDPAFAAVLEQARRRREEVRRRIAESERPNAH